MKSFCITGMAKFITHTNVSRVAPEIYIVQVSYVSPVMGMSWGITDRRWKGEPGS